MWKVEQHVKGWLGGLGCLALLLSGGSPACADNIDKELYGKARQVMKDLEDHGYKNVGILKFLVKQGNNPATLTAGKLNFLMATRLENALVMTDRPEAPIGLTRGASTEAAAKDKSATFLTLEGRKGLFRHEYSLAWGKQNVKVDAFLTGLVDIAPDMKKTKITIKAFERDNPEFRDVLSFSVDTDLPILRDTNQNFVVARRAINLFAAADDPEEELVKVAVQEAVKENQPNVPRKVAAEAVRDYLDFQILYNDQPVDITADGFVDKPTRGQTVAIKVRSKVKLGLLLRVNGVNTVDKQADEKPDLRAYSWWVLDPGVDWLIRGFYKNGQVEPFVAVGDADVDVSDLGENADRHGKIEFDVFVDPATLVKDFTPRASKNSYTLRTVTTRAASFEELKDEIRKNLPVQKMPLSRVLIVGGSSQKQELRRTAFDGRHVGGLTINYRKGPDR
jgi:hypothetical protein